MDLYKETVSYYVFVQYYISDRDQGILPQYGRKSTIRIHLKKSSNEFEAYENDTIPCSNLEAAQNGLQDPSKLELEKDGVFFWSRLV